VKRPALLLLLATLTSAPAVAQDGGDEGPIPTPAPRSMSAPADLKTALDECKTHPAVVNAGTPFDLCVEGYGFVKQGDKWVQKPATR